MLRLLNLAKKGKIKVAEVPEKTFVCTLSYSSSYAIKYELNLCAVLSEITKASYVFMSP